MSYQPKDFWENRLSKSYGLSGVGHIFFNERYNKWLYKAKLKALEQALSVHKIDIHSKTTVCDIGCGTGFFVDYYRQKKADDILGIDITSCSVDNLSKKYPEYAFMQNDISLRSVSEQINRRFDIINIFDVLYHIVDDNAFYQAIENITRLTKKNGYIFITDVCGDKDIQIKEHVKFRSRESYEKALKKNNAAIVKTHPMFYMLNRPLLGLYNCLTIRNAGKKLDNFFAPLYYCLDRLIMSSKRCNLNLIVIAKNGN